ncbi:DUF1450 domain-containing protein [Clostridium sp. DJ247]|uniref:DUF1450 domain-containing protein n=1 Tax=Clostridium sp. DJ247 TaxID=2726188 RepID=UPI001628251C|nr:DUF1450 domain-containing protein [Clostridium sp. DJ247]MBC2580872.1 DUF1450 domain-containing protein [Clostridium sp. DJ247]
MFKEIFFCENNVSKGLENIIEKIERDYPDVNICIEPCLGHCSHCAENLYAVIDAKIINGDNVEELYNNIKEELNQI